MSRVGRIRAVIFTGMPGSGKSEAVKVASELGLQVVRIGDAVWDEVRRRGLPLVAAEVGRVANEMRESHGPDVWALRTLEAVDPKGEVVVIDGLRSHAELAAFREALGEDLVLVLIDCPEEVRFARIASRGREDDTATREAFRARDERELAWGLEEVLATADVVIPNTGTLDALRARVRTLLESLVGT